MPRTSSTRWCPTPEQLMILEDMYRAGLRTPNASQIQHITAHLSYHGKIEGKNVFYWFQNHKARDRQKLRRNLSKQHHHHPHHQQQQQYETPIYWFQQNHLTNFPVLPHNPPHFHQESSEVREEMENRVMFGEHDWMMAGMGSTSCCNRPLRTLELFPMRSTGLKEEKINSSSPFSSSTSAD